MGMPRSRASDDTFELAFAVHDARAPGSPADTCGMAGEPRMMQPDIVGNCRLLHVQRPSLKQLEAALIHRPLDLYRNAHYIGCAAQERCELFHLTGAQALLLHEGLRNDLRFRLGVVDTADAMILAADRHMRELSVGRKLVAVRRDF